GRQEFSINSVKNGTANLKFKPLTGYFGNLGFTKNNFWLKFDLKNNLETDIFYYLQTAEPITDNVNLYLVDEQGKITVQRSGDRINFKDRSIANRKTLFKVEIKKKSLLHAFIEVKNDGEKNSLPLILISQQKLLKTTYQDQLMMGIFYGVLFIIAVTYFFFYFALREQSFLYYSLYVTFVGLCQFALDGYFHQYIDRSTSWINLHAVIVTAIFGAYFFGKYSEIILGVNDHYKKLKLSFKILYILLAIVLILTFLFSDFLSYAYPLINLLTLSGMLLIFVSIAVLFLDKQPIDIYFASGIFILFLCILTAILFNFGVFPDHISTDNITKPGIGLEIIALSLSMANRIRLLKSNKEEMQAIALQKSEEMNDVKTYFLSNMSHELRTPLNAILGLANLMENERDYSKIKENSQIIRDASYGLISSINDILDFSKIEKGELQLEAVHFKIFEVLEKVKIATKKQAEMKGLQFEFQSSISNAVLTVGDPVRLAQILHNLISNALKFTSKGTIVLKVESSVANEILLLDLSIEDTGIGIPKDKLDSVFGIFSQTEIHNKRKHGGFGIGLSIVKALVDLHQGEISLKSTVDSGTAFRVSLAYPIVTQAVENRDSFPGEGQNLNPLNVLVVEDNPMNQMVIK
ncbi:MAG: sensor histidine kinase, partial [Bacteroidia bacterium]